MEVDTMPQQPKNITKDKRSWWLSHEAFLYLKALAQKQGLDIPHFLEVHSRELARERLSEEERSGIIDQAKRISSERQEAAAPKNP